jgi:DNA-directed RNA polymerase subunit RPC12/RpoP
MRTCPNHQDRKAEYVCHGCAKFYCKPCLTEEGEYYFCNEPACQKLLQTERNKHLLLPTEVICPNCQSELNLDDNESKEGKVHCPECESFIDFTVNPPVVNKKKNIPSYLLP